MIRSFWPPFQSSSVDELISRFEGTEEIELGTLRWKEARPLVERAWQLGVNADYPIAKQVK